MSKNQKVALVVDDSKVQCKMLAVLLKEESYRVVTANDGATGVEMYSKYRPDLVLMDINMPIMDGYEAARRIKKISGIGNLAPLMFITSLDNDQAFIDSVEAGGDSILVRPFSSSVFKAKIKSIQRISDLVEQIKSLQQEQQKDAELAEKMMTEVIEARNYGLEKIGVIKKSATLFSGDIQLSVLCPNSDIHILLGDFTGHGLRASIGAIPITETFRTMTKKGFSILDIIREVNKQLYNLLPRDLFFAVSFASISEHDKSAYIFNAGLPEGYLFNEKSKVKNRFISKHPPLGILPDLLPDSQLEIVAVNPTDRLVFITDGVVEARNEQGQPFGFTRFENAAQIGIYQKDIAKIVLNSLDDFCQNAEQEDDISLVDVPCSGWVESNQDMGLTPFDFTHELTTSEHRNPSNLAWSYHLHLTGKLLNKTNPIPFVMNQINDLEGAGEHWQSLYTILTELFVNALDHGVLGLSSSLKNSAEGFSSYFNERSKRLKILEQHKLTNFNEDFIRITLQYYPLSLGGKMLINIKDSGNGFNVLDVIKGSSKEFCTGMSLSGRGVEIVNQLCETLEYKENGTLVIASYVWHDIKRKCPSTISSIS